jgi:hypothetical protein
MWSSTVRVSTVVAYWASGRIVGIGVVGCGSDGYGAGVGRPGVAVGLAAASEGVGLGWMVALGVAVPDVHADTKTTAAKSAAPLIAR